jgi:predicted dehydrogenase
VLVEKPIAASLEQADDLICLAQKAGVILQVGHVERFNPAFREISKLRLEPLFIESHRLAPFTTRGADVAVILDLMIHDIDLVLALVGGAAVEVQASGVAVLSDSEDIANARLTFSSGAVANLTASRISAKAMRKMRLFARDTYVSADFLDHAVEIFHLQRKGPLVDLPAHPLGPRAEEALLSKGQSIVCHRPQLDKGNALESELQSFLDSIRRNQPPAISGLDGRRALQLALRIIASLQEHARRISKAGRS